jgi:hypothetical protein
LSQVLFFENEVKLAVSEGDQRGECPLNRCNIYAILLENKKGAISFRSNIINRESAEKSAPPEPPKITPPKKNISIHHMIKMNDLRHATLTSHIT